MPIVYDEQLLSEFNRALLECQQRDAMGMDILRPSRVGFYAGCAAAEAELIIRDAEQPRRLSGFSELAMLCGHANEGPRRRPCDCDRDCHCYVYGNCGRNGHIRTCEDEVVAPGLFARLWAWLTQPKPFLMKPRWWRRSAFA